MGASIPAQEKLAATRDDQRQRKNFLGGYKKAMRSILVETLGATPLIKVLGFFLTFDSFDYSKSQVAEETGVSRITVDGIWRALEAKGIIVKTRVVGRAQLCCLNASSPYVKALQELNFKLASAAADNEVKGSADPVAELSVA